MPTTYRTYSGSGRIKFRDGYELIDVPFSIECKTNVRVDITVTIHGFQVAIEVNRRLLQSASLQGHAGVPLARVSISSITLYGATISTGQPSQFHFVPSGNKELSVYQSVPKVGAITLKLKLPLALEYSIVAKSARYLDIKFVMTFIALESLLTRIQNQLPKQTRRYMTRLLD